MACSSVGRHHHRQIAADREDVGVHLRRDGRGAFLELLVVAVDPLRQRAGPGVGETQCAEALLSGHRHRGRSGARDPHRRVRLLQRLGHHVARRHLDVLTLEPGERLLDHATDGNLECFLPHLALVRGIDTEPAELTHRRRFAGPEFHPPVGDEIERRHPLGDPGRMVDRRRQVHDPEPQPNVLGALAGCGQEDLGRGGVTVLLEEVVLGQPHRREAGLVGGLHLVETVLEKLVLVIVTPRPRQREFVEQRDLHLVTFRCESSVESVLPPPVSGSWSSMCLAAT